MIKRRLILVSVLLVGVGIIVSRNHCFVVLSGSMRPSLPVGSLLYTKSGKQPSIGQVIVYYHPQADALIAHRVVKMQSAGEEGWLAWTQGDANTNGDTWVVTPSQLQGVVMAAVTPINLVGGVITLIGVLHLLQAGWTYLSSR